MSKLYTNNYIKDVYVCVHAVWGPMDCNPPGFSSMKFSRQEYWSRLPFPTPGDLPNPGIKPASHLPTSATWETQYKGCLD